MYDYLSFLLVVAIALGLYQLARINKRLQSTDAKLAAILNHLGIEWGILAEPSEKVKDLAKVPESKIEAVRAYRQQTGAGLKEAVEVVETLSLQKKSGA